ncbi:ester cyclase [Devosia pacifica]|uniref:Ester cyclase n=1 Tax=Devosia pacifica TaxID=1335967 RepID=A0A918SBK6_9HYPH|nr:ester cyclase [Devosia pacifica]GHA32899.1 ester cyclase [Devosia pacifica]
MSEETDMKKSETGRGAPAANSGSPAKKEGQLTPGSDVMQVERHDFTDLVPENRPRVQSMKGFDECYTDIVDYIIRCTHKIWDERDIGLIYTHYTHNCVLYGTLGTMYTREEVVRDTIQRLVQLPERRGMGTHVIWNGNDEEGFYTSHLVTGTGRHTQYGQYGAPTGRTFTSRTVADCMIYQNKIYREWVVTDTMAVLKQLGVDPHGYAEKLAKISFDKGLLALDIGESRMMIGQYPPKDLADTSMANTDLEAETIQLLHDIYNRKMLGRIKQMYASNAQYHGPLMAELYGEAAITHQTLGLIGSMPDANFEVQHICSTPCEEGGTKVAIRWVMEGHHLGYGNLMELGDPTGKRIQLMGMTHLHFKNGKIVDEWRVFDQLAPLVQVKLAQMADRPSALPEPSEQPEG